MHHACSPRASTRKVVVPETHTVPVKSTSHAGHKGGHTTHTVPVKSTSHAGHKWGHTTHIGGVLHNMLTYN